VCNQGPGEPAGRRVQEGEGVEQPSHHATGGGEG